jgi:programmed cell death protein 5
MPPRTRPPPQPPSRRGAPDRSPPIASLLHPSPHQADDPELEAIRARRLAQLAAGAGGGSGGAPQTAEAAAARERAAAEAEDRRDAMLASVLTAEARARLARVALVKPDKARAVEDSLLRQATSGALGARVGEDALVALLDGLGGGGGGRGGPKIVIQRRTWDGDSE